jgi:hypothetical protein
MSCNRRSTMLKSKKKNRFNSNTLGSLLPTAQRAASLSLPVERRSRSMGGAHTPWAALTLYGRREPERVARPQ